MLLRISLNELTKESSQEIIKLVFGCLEYENEDNGKMIIKILIEIYRNSRPEFDEQALEITDFIINIYKSFDKIHKDAIKNSKVHIYYNFRHLYKILRQKVFIRHQVKPVKDLPKFLNVHRVLNFYLNVQY